MLVWALDHWASQTCQLHQSQYWPVCWLQGEECGHRLFRRRAHDCWFSLLCIDYSSVPLGRIQSILLSQGVHPQVVVGIQCLLWPGCFHHSLLSNCVAGCTMLQGWWACEQVCVGCGCHLWGSAGCSLVVVLASKVVDCKALNIGNMGAAGGQCCCCSCIHCNPAITASVLSLSSLDRKSVV